MGSYLRYINSDGKLYQASLARQEILLVSTVKRGRGSKSITSVKGTKREVSKIIVVLLYQS